MATSVNNPETAHPEPHATSVNNPEPSHPEAPSDICQ
jgi:hypothetical protein